MALTSSRWAHSTAMRYPPTQDKFYLCERSEEHTSELQSPCNIVCRLLLEKTNMYRHQMHVDVYCAAADRDAECRRVLDLGATHVRDSGDPEDAFVVFADPEGNLFFGGPI